MDMLDKEKSICFATCGSGGHVFPAINVARVMKEENKNVFLSLIIDSRGYSYLEKSEGSLAIFNVVNIFEIRRKSGIFFYYLDLFFSFFKTIKHLYKYNSKCLLSFGSYLGFIGIFASFISFIPSFYYFSDIVLSFNAKISAFFSTKFLYNFSSTKIPYLIKKKSIEAGYPFSKDFEEKERFDLSYSDFYKTDNINSLNILILGGSQGSQFITDIAKEAVILAQGNLKKQLNIHHQTRKEDVEQLRYFYLKNNINVVVSDFFQDVYSLMSKSHILISRSGASTIAEICKLGVPSILIPLSTAKNNHQFLNAKFLSDNEACFLMEEKALNSTKLGNLISAIIKDNFISSQDCLANMHSKLKCIKIENASFKISRLIKDSIFN